MSSWWRRYAETHGVTITGGTSWQKIVAAHFSAGATACSHPKRLAALVSTAGSPGIGTAGSWSRRLADDDNGGQLASSGARAMTLFGARSPMT